MRKGFSLLETVFASSVLALVIAAVMSSWLMFMHKSNRAYTQSELDMDVRKVIETFRAEIRNAARETIIFYPENESPAKAVGFALASDSDGDGLMDMDASGSNILWRQTVVYHVFDRSPTQMRRTLFTNRNTGGLYADYYRQIGQVVGAGTGSGACLPGESASTSVMFENLFTGKLWHADAPFDGYAPRPNTLEKVTFGSLPLGPGEHQVKFTVAGKNPQSSGRSVRLDQLSASVSGWPLEAETRPSSGASASPVFVGIGRAGAAYGLAAGTSADGESFTLNVVNDAIEECEFIGQGRNVTLSNTVVRFDGTYLPAGFNSGVYVTGLEGQFAAAWDGAVQSGDQQRSLYYYPTNCVMRIPLFGNQVVKEGFGPVFRLYKSLYNGGHQLSNPMYAALPSSGAGSPNSSGGEWIPLRFYQDGQPKASWGQCANQKYVELRPAQTQRLYAKTEAQPGTPLLLSFWVTVANYGSDRMTAFNMKNNQPGCWIIEGAGSNLVSQSVWSTNALITTLNVLPTLEAMAVGFADGGDYVSQPFDTKASDGASKTVTWDADLPAGSTLALYGRSGNSLTADGFGIADAPEWPSASLLASGGTVPGSGRYVQFRAVYRSTPYSAFPDVTGGAAGLGPYRSATPRLRRVFFSWDGGVKYVDVVANLLKGPDCGLFKVEVDGKSLVRGVTMEIEIFKDVLTQGGVKKERLRSAMMAEVEPRNSAKK